MKMDDLVIMNVNMGKGSLSHPVKILHHYPSSLINLFPDLSYYDHSPAPPWLHYADIPHHRHDYSLQGVPKKCDLGGRQLCPQYLIIFFQKVDVFVFIAKEIS